MTTRTDFYLGSGPTAEWIGSLQFACHPDNLLKDRDGRAALTATTPSTYRVAVDQLLSIWGISGLGATHHPRNGWPWPWDTSHGNDWIITFLGETHGTTDATTDAGTRGRVHMTAGGGDRWHALDPTDPRPPLRCGPPDFSTWLSDPGAPPAVPLPTYRYRDAPATTELAQFWR